MKILIWILIIIRSTIITILTTFLRFNRKIHLKIINKELQLFWLLKNYSKPLLWEKVQLIWWWKETEIYLKTYNKHQTANHFNYRVCKIKMFIMLRKLAWMMLLSKRLNKYFNKKVLEWLIKLIQTILASSRYRIEILFHM